MAILTLLGEREPRKLGIAGPLPLRTKRADQVRAFWIGRVAGQEL
jgi:hypothetical protein